MKTIKEFVSYLNNLDVKLRVNGKSLVCDAPQQNLTPNVLNELKERKAEILSFLKQTQTSTNSTIQPIIPISRDTDILLSFGQQRLWLSDKIDGVDSAYNEFSVLEINGNLQINSLEKAFQEIIRRHEILRTTFPFKNDSPVQKIVSSLTISIPVVNLESLSEKVQSVRIQKFITEEQTKSFDLSKAPLIKVSLLRLSEVSHLLLLSMHHIITDGWSIGILIRELGTLYQAFCNGKPSPLPELPVQYADFSHWQRQQLSAEMLTNQLNYWQKQLAELPPLLELPTERPRPPKQTFRGSSIRSSISPQLTQQLKLLSKKSGATLYMVLLAAFTVLLSRYSSQEDLAVGSAIANRNHTEIESLIGFFLNNLVVRINLAGNPSFSELLLRVRQVSLDAYANQDLPFDLLVDKLQPERSASYSPLFQVAFVLQNLPIGELELPGLTLKPWEIEKVRVKNDLTLTVEESESGLRGLWEFNLDLFDTKTIDRMAGHFQNLLESIVANPQQSIAQLSMLTASEQQQLLVEWNNTQIDYPQAYCIHELFEAQVKQTPDAVALVFADEELTYQQLNSRANQLAKYLQTLGVKPETPVAICLERSVEMLVGLLGILKAGGAYVPLDPSYPLERLSFMLEDAQPPVVLTKKHLLNQLPGDRQIVVCLDSDWGKIAKYSPANLISDVTVNNLAYIIYTSGSTGKPKGVLIDHQGLGNLATEQIRVFDVQPNSRVLQFASFSFDASVSEIFMALCSGATLCLGSSEELLPGANLIKFLQRQKITHITLPPSALAVMPRAELPELKVIIVAGEACNSNLIAQWSANRRFFNAYGPTESTVCATIAEYTPNSSQSSIGRPIANTQVYLLDHKLQPVPVGVKGELHIGGVGLARGYLNQPKLTEEKFIPNPFSDRSDRLYKTGDLARYLPDGNIEFLGRIDHQVKIRGYRIEISEIETLLHQHQDVQVAVVIVKENQAGEKRLVVYLVKNKNNPHNSPQFYKDYLRQHLPEFMIPSDFIFLDSLLLSPNGKVNRRALSALDNRREQKSDLVVPRNTLELELTQIWEEILDIRPIGIEDNFFDLGGNSLLAIRLIARIEQQYEQSFSLTQLFEAPTITQIASHLNSLANPLTPSPLVKIKSGTDKQPFFFMPGGGGVVLYLYHLAHHLDSNQAFYGLQPQGLDGEELPHAQVEEIAAYNIQALQTVQPQGPYLLGGHSFGSFVAFEMALQLQLQGQQVALLALLDTPAPVDEGTSAKDEVDDATYLVGIVKNVERLTGESLDVSHADLNLLKGDEQLDYLLQRLKNVNIFPPEANLKQLRGLLQVFKANDRAVYYPQSTYSQQITVFRAGDNHDFGDELAMGWERFSSVPVETHLVPGDHITMMNEPHVRTLAQKLRECLKSQIS